MNHLLHASRSVPAGAFEFSFGTFAAVVAVAVVAIGGELVIRTFAQRRGLPSPGGFQPTLTPRGAQQFFERVMFVIAPSAVAAAIAAVRDESAALGLLVFAAVLLCTGVMWPSAPRSTSCRWRARSFASPCPAVGLLVALSPGLVGSWDLTPVSALPPCSAPG